MSKWWNNTEINPRKTENIKCEKWTVGLGTNPGSSVRE